MKEKFLPFVLSLVLFASNLFSQSAPPKREFRGAWIATVVNLDWPSSNTLTTDQQKSELTSLLDRLKAIGINAVIFQVRSECDAMYNSHYEPWSYWLTGQQGKPPSPYYDPLAFAVQEAHKRGMEIHAWFNPYRAVRDVKNAYPAAQNHVTVLHSDWIVTYGNIKVLNPGIPAVRDYIAKIISDVVRRYDIDGVHFDDYFYPYPDGVNSFNDAATFQQYPNGFTNIDDWRRNNVNLLIKEVHDSIKAVKPYVKFGISPFGIWKSGVPSGISGLSSYDELYADCMFWMRNHYIDYLTPQLYWKLGGKQDYKALMLWYADSAKAYGRDFYPGEAAYHINNWTASEMPNHLRLDRSAPNCQGNIYFRALVGLLDNEQGFADSLKNNFYRYPALSPIMKWIDSVAPNPIQNLRFDRIPGTAQAGLIWDSPTLTVNGDSAVKYVVYKFNSNQIQQQDVEKASNIYDVTGENYNLLNNYNGNQTGTLYLGVTSLDHTSNESSISNLVQVEAPGIVALSSPLQNAPYQRDTINFIWNYTGGASNYNMQVSTDSTFVSNLLVNVSGLSDTIYSTTNLLGLQKYYWRVNANNIAGAGDYSNIFSFITGFPRPPVLLSPLHASTNISLDTTLVWAASDSASQYELQISRSLTITPDFIILDSSNIIDTTYNLQNMNQNTAYFWRVRAMNKYGSSAWSKTFGFRTRSLTFAVNESKIAVDFSLSQNYPNPFNNSTVIKFSLPESGYVSLKIYNILGSLISEPVKGNFSAGNYSIEFNAGILPSGIYIYTMSANNKFFARKMVLMK
ncbi:MAG: family 10 glycosylhydrolase [Ignavibacteriaceae bacterium]